MLQKRAVRARSDFRAHTAPLFIQLKILDIFKLNTFHIAKFMFYYHYKLLPSSFLELFTKNSQIHTYGTSIASQYRSHKYRTNIKQFTILYQGPKIWNSLPPYIISLTSFSSFKKKLIHHLLST